MKISVVTVCFNEESTTENTIKSVIGQTYNDYEYIIMDGSSTDGTDKLFKGIYVYYDPGMGIAPWNVDDYVKEAPLVFYHFHSMDVFPDGTSNIRVFIRPGRHNRELVEALYKPYIRKIIEKRTLLRNRFGLFEGEKSTVQKLHEGEIRSFLTSEPNPLFLIRKILRYLLYKRYDYLSCQ